MWKMVLLLTMIPIVGYSGDPTRDELILGKLVEVQKTDVSFLAIECEKRISTEDEEGNVVSAKSIQLAGLEGEALAQLRRLIGKDVAVRGRLMLKHTLHHQTPILVIVSSVKVVSDHIREGAEVRKEE